MLLLLIVCVQEAYGISLLRRVIRGFDRLDTTYIEPQKYNLTMMLQSTYKLDQYTIVSESGQEVTLSPDPQIKLGPFFGWRWVFVGYTFDIKNIGFCDNGQKRQFDISLYSSQLGIDLFYRRTGSDYKLRRVYLGDEINTRTLENVPFDGVNAGISGFNLYYIGNHGRFSYPAAFSQSTVQKISCGSWIAGVGYTSNSLDLDYAKLQRTFDEYLGHDVIQVDSSLFFDRIKYTDYTVSGGYAWNQVLPHHWLLAVSGQLGLAYKKSTGEVGIDDQPGFDFTNVNVDVVGRFGAIYNNMRWYAGVSAIVHSSNYRKPRFRTNNTFGNINMYIGYNFGKKSRYKNKESNYEG